MANKQKLVEVEGGVIPQEGIIARHYGFGDEGDGNRLRQCKKQNKNPVRCHGNMQGRAGRRC